jgi:hypothetical protein
MGAKVLYTAKGTDPAVIVWPAVGPASDRFNLISGQVVAIAGLIGYGDGSITYADGRLFPALSAQGSTMVHQKTS